MNLFVNARPPSPEEKIALRAKYQPVADLIEKHKSASSKTTVESSEGAVNDLLR
jgi:hypothetical protein